MEVEVDQELGVLVEGVVLEEVLGNQQHRVGVTPEKHLGFGGVVVHVDLGFADDQRANVHLLTGSLW